MRQQQPIAATSAAVLAGAASMPVIAAPVVAAPVVAAPVIAAPGIAAPAPAPAQRHKWLGIVLPNRSDPRLKLSVTILVLTVFGQTILRFDVSVTQIAVAVAICAGVDLAMTYRRERELVWPASGIQTGLSVGYIFRANGTLHGALWSTHGLQFFVIVSAASIASKYLIRFKRHIFNPSNFGIALGLLVFSPAQVFSEHLWWGPLGVRLGVTVAVIVAGGYWVLRQVKMLSMAAAFLATFAVVVAVFAVLGRGYSAVWHSGPVTGLFYWETLAVSPEVMIFALFMISDPQTAPKARRARIAYGVVIALLAGALIYPQATEFGIKAALVVSLLASCALVPVIEFACANGARTLASARTALGDLLTWPRVAGGWRVLAGTTTAALVLVLATAAVVRTVTLAHNPEVARIDGGAPHGGPGGPVQTGFGGDLQN